MSVSRPLPTNKLVYRGPVQKQHAKNTRSKVLKSINNKKKVSNEKLITFLKSAVDLGYYNKFPPAIVNDIRKRINLY